jgi:hypothetical protein
MRTSLETLNAERGTLNGKPQEAQDSLLISRSSFIVVSLPPDFALLHPGYKGSQKNGEERLLPFPIKKEWGKLYPPPIAGTK